MVLLNLSAGQDVETGFVDTAGEGEGGRSESSNDIYTCNRELVGSCDTGSSARRCHPGGRGWEEGSRGRGEIHILMADACCGMAETNTTL